MVRTLHKVHDVSLHEDVITFNLQRQKLFNKEQIHVTLSRIRGMQKHFLLETITTLQKKLI